MACFVASTAYLHTIEIACFSLLTVLAIHFLETGNKLTRKFGDISYSLYLTHGLVGGNIMYLISRYTTSFSGKILLVIMALVVSLLFSYLFWRLVENPSRKLSGKLKMGRKKKGSVV